MRVLLKKAKSGTLIVAGFGSQPKRLERGLSMKRSAKLLLGILLFVGGLVGMFVSAIVTGGIPRPSSWYWLLIPASAIVALAGLRVVYVTAFRTRPSPTD